MMMEKISNIARSRAIRRSSQRVRVHWALPTARLAISAGSASHWALEICAPERITRALGLEGQERLVRAYGLCEVAAGMLSLSIEKKAGLCSRVTGTGLDSTTLMADLQRHPKKGNVAIALIGWGHPSARHRGR